MKRLAFFTLALCLSWQLSVTAQERAAIQLTEINGRAWLIAPDGTPFFAHGITHSTNRSLSHDYDALSKACKQLGFNAYGYGCPAELKKDMPYVEGRNYVPISTYMRNRVRFIDIFDPREQRKLSEQVKQRCLENRDNPNLIGYYWTDLSAWPLKNSTGKNWVDSIRDLPAESPGQMAYAEFLDSWQGNDTSARDLAFLRLIAREYFRVMGEANQKHDPDHLIFGDRFAFTSIVPEVMEEMLPWVDAIAIQPNFQPGFPKAKFDKIHKLTKKPIVICDFAIRFKDGNKSIRGWQLQEDARSAGVQYSKYIRDALETPYIIGAFWCNPVDSTPSFNKDSGVKQGLFSDGLKPRAGLGEAMLELNEHIAKVTPKTSTSGKISDDSKSAPGKTSSDISPKSNPDETNVAASEVVGNRNFIHLENDHGIWWLSDHTGERFITTGMNHVGEGGVLFNEVNKGWLTEKFGDDIQGSWGGLNPRAEKIGDYADMVVKDFKDYSFNTIPFHAYSTPLKFYEERKIFYVAKIKVQNISLMQMNRNRGDRFPDVFSSEFRELLDGDAKKVCTPLRNAKYCLGYSYFDMPDLKPVRQWHRKMFPDAGLVYPWVQDMRALPAEADGKQAWIRILKNNHRSAAEAAKVYAIDGIESWEELAKVTLWPAEPNDATQVQKDAEDMLTELAEKWYGLHHELIRKYDPNHLILGDKHDVGYDMSVDMIPDGVLNAISKYSDVLVIQYYSFYTDQHNAVLRKLHRKTGLPIINGDHSYAFKTPKHTKIKGLEVESFEAVANEYQRYLKGTMQDHPYMLGWWYCGYIEQWAPAGTKQLGQQCGFFSPFGKPNEALLLPAKEANENAVKWHSQAVNKGLPQLRESEFSTAAEMFVALKLSLEQKSKLEALEKERKLAVVEFQKLDQQMRQDAEDKFYSSRKKKLREIFTEEQWTIWSRFWDRSN
ncbi:MAG: hypothetical protein AAFN77_07510 [Planctomycetota bacterium]